MSTEDVERLTLLKKQRAAYKGQLTVFKNQLVSASSLGSYESLLRRTQLMYEKYSLVQLNIETTDDTQSSDRDNFEDEYGKLEASILNRISECKKTEELGSSASFHNNSVHDLSLTTGSPVVRLPELKLPSFNGLESEWLAFRDVFIDLIHSKNIDSTVKFVYLTSHIRSGSAYALIENLPVTAENYELAWKTICDRYNNEVAIQRVHMKAIYDIKSPQEHSAKSLQIFVDIAVKHYNALKSLKVKVDEWDLMLTHHLTQRLDSTSRKEVIRNAKVTQLLTFSELIELIRSRIRLLNEMQSNSAQSQPTRSNSNSNTFSSKFKKPIRSSVLVADSNNCAYCTGNHVLPNCPSFRDTKLSPQMRLQFIRENRLCSNCLIERHNVRDCLGPSCCKCSFKHHEILHFRRYQDSVDRRPNPTSSVDPSRASSQPNMKSVSVSSGDQNKSYVNEKTIAQVSASSLQSLPRESSSVNSLVMIGTALVIAVSSSGDQLCRALLDSGSHLNFITTEACTRLKAKRYPTVKTISGINGRESEIRHKIYLTIKSRVTNYSVELKFYVLSKITNNLPSIPCDFNLSSIPVELNLADPYFHVPDRIDLLLGVEVYHQLFKGQQVILATELPPFHNTELGYVVCGRANTEVNRVEPRLTCIAACSIESLNMQMRQFWELETVSPKSLHSEEEKACEEHYRKHVKRLSSGRYSVALPFKSNIDQLGSSGQSAYRQFISLEKRLSNRINVNTMYKEFMSEYLSLGHMVLSTSENPESWPSYYLPHHFVLKDNNTTTKFRVVFNASAKTSTQLSLNDCLMVGPTIQQTLFALILRFRKHIYAFCGDITKMYRQIRVHDKHQDFQRIWWRDKESEPLRAYKLCTVTYGTSSAPFLATRTLQQLSMDENPKFPHASQVLSTDFYVDDVLTGASTLNDAMQLQDDLIGLLKLGGFELRKFQSNHTSLASETNIDSATSLLLGLTWNTASDSFVSSLNKLSVSSFNSKRNVLSEICQLFDPLGFCAPVLVVAKLVMQKLWTITNIGWDDPIPPEVEKEWIRYKTELLNLKPINIPRCILTSDTKRIELHGFGDASEKAFGCVFYVRVTDSTNHHQIRLLCAKSRVAPLKKQSIPRLELCAALLLAELTNNLIEFLAIQFDKVFLWSDSEITLFRIRSEPHKYTTFVANRVAKIQEISASTIWQYVNTSQNPADYVSRGLMPSEFLAASLWWSGPEFLTKPNAEWPKPSSLQLSNELADLEVRQPVKIALTQSESYDHSIFTRFHSLTKLLRVVSYIFRFYNSVKRRFNSDSTLLGTTELNMSLKTLLKLAQQSEFVEEIKCLTTNQSISSNKSLRSLSLFLDQDGIIRVGGRLRNADLPYDSKHQILLSNSHPLTKLIVTHEHLKLLHAGPQALLYSLRLQYWIPGGRNLCRKIVHQCIRCFHARPRTQEQIMADLPVDRVTQSTRPFLVVGIDFCGPFTTKPTIRSKITIPCYVCLFVCFNTKAVHLELVMSLSTESFISCLRRFVARRGLCSKIFSDNATNFVGARAELQKLKKLFLSQDFIEKTSHYCVEQNIEWCTIPPRSPHFGGLWESGIKSAKPWKNTIYL